MRHPANAVMAALLVVLVAWLSMFAMQSSVHRTLHADGQAGDDSCAICLFVHGQFTATVAAAILYFVAALGIVFTCLPFSARYTIADFLLLPERAPPAYCLLRVR